MTTSVQEQREYTSSATLTVLGAKLVPATVSEFLRMRPSDSWKRGDPKVFRGKRMGQSLHEWGGWKKHLPPSQMTSPLDRQIRYWARALEGKSEVFSKLTSMGCRCTLDCFIGTSETASINLEPQLQAAIGRLGLALELNVWAGSA